MASSGLRLALVCLGLGLLPACSSPRMIERLPVQGQLTVVEVQGGWEIAGGYAQLDVILEVPAELPAELELSEVSLGLEEIVLDDHEFDGGSYSAGMDRESGQIRIGVQEHFDPREPRPPRLTRITRFRSTGDVVFSKAPQVSEIELWSSQTGETWTHPLVPSVTLEFVEWGSTAGTVRSRGVYADQLELRVLQANQNPDEHGYPVWEGEGFGGYTVSRDEEDDRQVLWTIMIDEGGQFPADATLIAVVRPDPIRYQFEVDVRDQPLEQVTR
jgi:hypothetical protein